MAIKMKRPTFYKISAVKEFTDRVEPRKAFWNRYAKMIAEGSTVISFYGAGGVGKSALLKKLEEEIKRRDELTGNECKYVKYDFSNGTDVREILKTLKFQLTAYGCTFPFFDVGNYYYSLKIGQEVAPPKVTPEIEKIPWIKETKKLLSKAGNFAGSAMTTLNTVKMFFNATSNIKEDLPDLFLKTIIDGLGKSMPVMRTVTTFMSIANVFLAEYLKRKGVEDEDHAAIRAQLNNLWQEQNPNAIYEFLPTLFAMDVSDWLKESNNKLVVLLDNYESLISATSVATTEQLKHDLWIRGDQGLLFMIPDTLWTIAGRNKLRWGAELDDELDQHLIKALSPEDSNWFLEKANIKDEKLREDLVKLTGGYPIFLDLCVNVYVEYKRQHDNAEPTIDEFGQKREEVVGRIFRYLDEDKDDAAKDMLEFLCTLSVWTDELAVDIGGASLPNFSINTYKRVKNFSFIQSERFRNEDISLRIFKFDKTIQSLIINTCDETLIAKVTTAVDEYFKKIFADKKIFDDKETFYLKLWANFIVHFVDDAETLRKQFKDKLGRHVDVLTECAQFNAAEEILKRFMNKLENLDVTDSVAYAYFERRLSWIKRSQGKYNEAHALAKSAYDKCVRLLNDDNDEQPHPDTVRAMQAFANSLSDLGRYEDALEWREKVLTLSEKIFGDEHSKTIDAMSNLANSLNDLGHYNDALKRREKVLTLSEENFGAEHPKTIDAMNNLANSLYHLGRYDEALERWKKVLTLSKKIFGDEHLKTIYARNNLTAALRIRGRYDEVLKLQEKVLALSKKNLGVEHPYTVIAMNNLAIMLNSLGRYDEALKLQKKALELRKEIFGDKHPKTLNAMNNLSATLSNLGRHDEALKLREQVLTLRKQFHGDKNPDTLMAMNNLAITLSELGRHDEAWELLETASPLFKEVFNDKQPNALVFANTKAVVLKRLGRCAEAVTLQRDTLTHCERILSDSHPLTIDFTKDLAEFLFADGNREEALQVIERATTAAKEKFGDSHPETKKILDLREKILNS